MIEAVVDLAGGLEAPGGVDAPGRGLAFARYENVKAYAAVIAELTVDARTGLVVVEQGWIAADAGEVIDPDGLVNQLEGGFVQAASWTLKEQVEPAEGGPGGGRPADWDGYPILRFGESPERQPGCSTDPRADPRRRRGPRPGHRGGHRQRPAPGHRRPHPRPAAAAGPGAEALAALL